MRPHTFRHAGLIAIFLGLIGLAFAMVVAPTSGAQASQVQILYSFTGKNPYPVDIVYIKGSFYGVTESQGTAHPGTFFRLSRDGSAFTTLHVFKTQTVYPVNPGNGLLALDDVIYGTTSSGGVSANGDIYRMTRSGTKTILHTFDFRDGSDPFGLTNVGGMFYGATRFGGNGSGGTFFRLSPDGSGFQTLYAFKRDSGAIRWPTSIPTYLNSTFYGMAAGRSDDRGVIYSLTAGGHPMVLHQIATNFNAYNTVRITPFNGLLYGTTYLGSSFDGAVFSMGIDGSGFKFVHAFKGAPSDGSDPRDLINVGDKLYGVTGDGGKFGKGTIYSIDASGEYSILYHFPGYPDGDFPIKLFYVDGALYGLTLTGGTQIGPRGVGTVFKFTP